MKLHLPKGLRTALLAVVAISAAAPFAAEARKPAPLPAAAYELLYVEANRNLDNACDASSSNSSMILGDKTVDRVDGDGYKLDDQGHNLQKVTSDGCLEFTNPNDPANPHIDPNNTDWVLEIVATDVTCIDNETVMYGEQGAILFANGYVGSNEMRDVVHIGATRGYWGRETLYLTPVGNIHLCVFGDSAGLNSSADNVLARVDRHWADGDPLNLKFTFVWDADGGGRQSDGTYTGAMTFTGAYIVDMSTGSPIEVKDISTMEKGHVVWDGRTLDHYFFTQRTDPEVEFADRYNAGGFYASAGEDSNVEMSLYVPGKQGAWVVRNQVDIQDLYDGKYMDYTGLQPTERELTAGEQITFSGDAGTIYLSSGEMTYDHPTTVEANLFSGVVAKSVGFGAARDAKLTVAERVLDSTVFATAADGRSAGLRITGAGTVVLELSEQAAQHNVEFNSIAWNSKVELRSDENVSVVVTESKIGEQASITRNADSGEGVLTLIAKADTDAVSSMKFKSLSNMNGGITVIGGSRVENGANTLTLDTLDATGDVNVQVKTTVNGDINAGGSVLIDNTTTAANVNAGAVVTMMDSGRQLTTGALKAGERVSVFTGNTLRAETIETKGVVLVTNTADTASITANEIVAKSAEINLALLDAEGMQVLDEDGNPVAGNVSLSVADDAPVAPLLSGRVSMTKDGIVADAIADNSNISIDAASPAVLATRKMADASLTVGGTAVLTKASTNSAITMGATGTVVSGELTAEQVTLPEGYSLQAAALASTNGVTAGGTSFTGETTMTKVAIADKVVTADSITTDDATLADGSVLNKAILTAASVTLGDAVVLNGVTLNSSRIITRGKAKISGFTVGGGKSFGGDNADAFTVGAGLNSLGMTGNLDGANISLKHITVGGQNLAFSDDPAQKATHTLLTANSGSIEYKWTKATGKDVLLPYLPSYVEIDNVWIENGQLKLQGHKDQERIENELTDNATRKAALNALKTATPDGEDSALKGITDYIGQVNLYSLDERQEVLTAVAGASAAALADSQRRGVQDVQKNLRNRIIQMGGGTNAGLTTDWKYAGIQAWAQADGSFTSSNSKDGDPGYDFNTWGATVGANFDLTANTVVGMSFSASYGELDVDSPDSATGNNDAYYLNLFARHQKERWVQMLIVTFGTNDIDLERTVQSYKGEGTTDGTSVSAYYEIGYTYGLNYEFTHILQPLLSVSLTSAKVDGYTEKGPIGDAAITYDGDSYVYGTLGIGARYQGVLYKTVHERNAVVEARAFITQDFGDTTDEAVVAVGDGEAFKVNGADTAGTGFELGVGLSLPVEQHTTIYADADATFRADYTGFRANLGVRYDF